MAKIQSVNIAECQRFIKYIVISFCGIKKGGSAKITPLPIHYVDNIAVHRDYTSSNGLPPSVKRPNIGRRVLSATSIAQLSKSQAFHNDSLAWTD